MKLTFLGTRGEIEPRNRRHRRHTALLVEYRHGRAMVDCGDDWRGRLDAIAPEAIVLTHAHPDHAWGLDEGAPCPVYATAVTWEDIGDYPIEEGHTVEPEQPVTVDGITFTAYTVEHSTRCPAVGYRIEAGRAAVWYAPDLVYIHKRAEALRGVKLYIGDGATLTRSMVRRRGERLIGHAPVRTQLTWCEKEGVPEAIVTHCGSQIVAGDERKVGPQIDRWAAERGISARIAFDGMEWVVR
jgi:phosphoribosyl 1,2-cyclic phosphodiesterase